MTEPKEQLEPLNPEAQALIEELRASVEPPAGAQVRVGEAMEAASGSNVAIVLAGVAGVAIVVAVLVFGPSDESDPPAHEPTPAVVVDDPVDAAPVEAEREPPAIGAVEDTSPEPPATEPPQTKPPARNRSTERKGKGGDDFERELDLLDKAKKAAAKGQQDEAIRLLRQHAKEFKTGVLAAERDAALVVAWCTKGDAGQAERAAKRFVKRHPGSHLGERVRRSCAGPALRGK
jgi:type IV secretory pathway VirB10-like protein